MYFTIYKITNLVNGKIYIGAHKTKNLDDKYMGGGTQLKRAQKKYGIENFKREFLEFLPDEKSMYAREAEVVTEEFIKLKTNYNEIPGGHGGWNHLNGPNSNSPYHTKEHMQRMQERRLTLYKNEPSKLFQTGRNISKALKGRKFPGRKISKKTFENSFLPHVNKKRSEKLKGRYVGGKNPNAKRVIDDAGNVFDSIIQLCEYHLISDTTARKRIRKNQYTLLPL